MLDALSRFAGRELDVDEAVFASERATGDRNRAIAYLLRNYAVIEGDVDAVLDVYFRQCSILVTARDLAVMAATLANRGINPVTGEQVVAPYAVARTLSVMTSSGMYDYAGEWVYRVGIPAKSGVGGGIIAALPAQFGLGTFSPLLDSHGNSVRGLKVCEEFRRSSTCMCSIARATCAPASSPTTTSRACRRAATGSRTSSEFSTNITSDIRVIELVGALSFANDRLRHAPDREHEPRPQFMIIDLRRVPAITEGAARLLGDKRRRC